MNEEKGVIKNDWQINKTRTEEFKIVDIKEYIYQSYLNRWRGMRGTVAP